MASPSLYSDLNIMTSVAGFFANKLTAAGWAVYWQALGIFSGTATQGEVTMVPEFPAETTYLVLGPRDRTENEIIVPAFSVGFQVAPEEIQIAGLGDTEYESVALVTVDGFCANKQQHLLFSTYMRKWFQKDTVIPIYNWEDNPVTPDLVDDRNVYIRTRQVEIITSPNLPNPVRYYLNMTAEIVFYD